MLFKYILYNIISALCVKVFAFLIEKFVLIPQKITLIDAHATTHVILIFSFLCG